MNFSKIFFSLIFNFISVFCFAQEESSWYAFYNSDSTKIGFKDINGNIKIEPKFEPHLINQVFKNVIIVSEQISDKSWSNYYLNKQGKKFGIDSLYIFDFEYAREQEGKIKFRDYKTDKVGFFDKNGKIVIPALYDDAEDFNNDLAVVIKGAHKKNWEPEVDKHVGGCDHWYWDGGKTLMINSKNVELFEIPDRKDFSYTIDYSNFKLNEKVDSDIYISYRGKDGNTYSFYSPEKDFNKWFKNTFLSDLKKHKKVLPKYFYNLIAVDDNDHPEPKTAWKNHRKEDILSKNQKQIDAAFLKILNDEYIYNSTLDIFSNSLYDSENEFPKENIEKNSVILLYIQSKKDLFNQTQFQFTKIGNAFYITSAPYFQK